MSEENLSNNEQECNRPLPTTSYDGTDNLCEECAQIDFDAMFDFAFEWDGHRGVVSKPISSIRTSFQDKCRLCDMAKTSLQRQHSYYPSKRDGREAFHFRACYDRSKGSEGEVFVVAFSLVDSEPQEDSFDEWVRGGVIVDSCTSSTAGALSTASRCLGKRKLSRKYINYDEVRSWLQGSHFPSCQNVSSLTRAVDTFERYAIDCETRQIIVLQENMEYLALSYVWGWHSSGESNETFHGHPLDHSRQLPPNLPQTIEDALSVVKHLHRRYLWIDRYCIPSWADKHAQIQNMDQIYRCATATIVAVDPDPNTSSNSGLYGVSRARIPQQVLQVGHRELLLTAPHLSYPLANSKWATRGWTFQEARLSGRCLFFTEDQVYCYCGRRILSEDTIRGVSNQRKGKLSFIDTYMKPRFPILRLSRESDLRSACLELLVDIEEYTSRTLTYETDILNAFYGILRSAPVPTLWGVPLTIQGESLWIGALLWNGQHQEDGTTWSDCLRPGFPSWSWLSRRDHVKFHWWAHFAMYQDIYPDKITILREHGWVGLADHLMSETGPSFPPPLKIKGPTARIHLRWAQEDSLWAATLPTKYNDGTEPALNILPRPRGISGCDRLMLDRVYSPLLLSRLQQQETTWPTVRLFEWPPHSAAWMVLDDSASPCTRVGLLICQKSTDMKLLKTSQESTFHLN